AYFDVSSDPKNPFIIKTNNAEITVLGTKFYVTALENKATAVRVVEGRVQVKYPGDKKSFIVQANQQIGNDLEKVTTLNKNKIYWNTKSLV
ncbi:FecR domain-containing protein, partial [Xanthovirga aplysinae]|uniref:FecR domain-containing protein n=1 Tax=Xanthovirga aplysinae TaxID=2529853 RepID=UPI0016571B25